MKRELDLVRELGFDTEMYADGPVRERVFFLGPRLLSGQERGGHATEAAVKEFIAYWENQIAVAKDYLANGRTNLTTEWKVKS